MTAIVTSNFRVINAENFKEDVADTDARDIDAHKVNE